MSGRLPEVASGCEQARRDALLGVEDARAMLVQPGVAAAPKVLCEYGGIVPCVRYRSSALSRGRAARGRIIILADVPHGRNVLPRGRQTVDCVCGNPSQPMSASGSQSEREAISGNQRHSVAISGRQAADYICLGA